MDCQETFLTENRCNQIKQLKSEIYFASRNQDPGENFIFLIKWWHFWQYHSNQSNSDQEKYYGHSSVFSYGWFEEISNMLSGSFEPAWMTCYTWMDEVTLCCRESSSIFRLLEVSSLNRLWIAVRVLAALGLNLVLNCTPSTADLTIGM